MKNYWQEVKLGDICEYSRNRISISEVNLCNYVSTENLLKERAGKTIADTIPEQANLCEYNKGCTLISNIRPYFKKIWFANTRGGCSNDVLVYKPNNGINDKWLYYLLSQDSFFNFVMSGTKGTKMPRGDKSQIMKFPVALPPLDEQRKIAGILSALDDKIELNNKINRNLEAQAQAIFKSWFIDFEPFKNGKFIDSELGKIPEDWKVVLLSNIANFEKGKKPKTIFENGNDGVIPYLTIEALSGGNVTYCETEKMVLAKENEILLVMDGASSGTLFYGMEGAVASTIAKLNSSDISLQEIIFEFISYRQEDLKSHNTGSAIPHLDKTYLLSYKMVIPSDKTLLLKVSFWLKTLRAKIIQNKKESQRLAQLRDTLLPKLMSGEIDVSDVAV